MKSKLKALTTSNSNFGAAYNTSYQDNPFSDQLSVSTTGIQITPFSGKAGWVTVAVQADVFIGNIFIGNSGVSSSGGFKLSQDGISSITVSSDDLSSWYVLATGGTTTVSLLGAYRS